MPSPVPTISPTATVPPPTATATAPPPTATAPPPTATAPPPTATAPPPTATAPPPTATLVPTAAAAAESGAWEFVTSSDAMTDRQSKGIALRSTSYVPGEGDDRAILYIRCSYGGKEPPRWDIFIAWDDYLGSDDPVRVLQRFGDEDPVASQWDLSTNNEATFVRTRGERLREVSFLNLLQRNSRFAARVTQYDDAAITATWDVAGLTVALRPLQEHCP